MSAGPGERLQKALARAGVGSRRACDELIRTGRVTINGSPAALGSRVEPDHDEVAVDGVKVNLALDLAYLALHKPAGVVTTARDTHARPIVTQLVPEDPRVFPVGRLDMNTTGLLLLTNDGEFANRVAHPRFGIKKVYVAEVRGDVDRATVRSLTDGVALPDGRSRAESVRVKASSKGRALVEVVVHEGRNRLVRRMLDAVGLEVLSLVRTSIGPVRLGRLKPGDWRHLTHAEIHELGRLAAGAETSNA